MILNFIREKRFAAGLTQLQLGQLIGVSDETISSYERGVFHPSLLHAFRLMEALDCDFGDLFFIIEEG